MVHRLRVYLDHNAGAPLRPEVAELLVTSIQRDTTSPGNPSSVHAPGREARSRLTAARRDAAAALGVLPKELLFTASGSEANAWALRGAFLARRDLVRRRVVASSIEHPAALLALEALRTQDGAELALVPPEANGAVDVRRFIEAIDDKTALVSLMWANNETGVLQPVEEIAHHCAARSVPFHSDAVQAVGRASVDLERIPVALLSLSGHKLGAPAGVGALVARTPLSPLIPGHQEAGLRGGTASVATCEALALALTLAQRELDRESSRQRRLRDGLEDRLRSRWPALRINGASASRLSNTSNLLLEGVDAEALLIALDLDGISVSTGAACASGSLAPSHVLLAMGLTSAQARSSLRVSLGRTTSADELEALVSALFRHVEGQSSLPNSPLTSAAIASGVPTRSS